VKDPRSERAAAEARRQTADRSWGVRNTLLRLFHQLEA
jgi:hypothetical protein